MEYNYKLETFISTPNDGDVRIIIYDKNGNFNYSIAPSNISHTYVKNNCLVIKIFNKNDISLTFETSEYAKSALIKLDTIRKSFGVSSSVGDAGSSGTSGASGGTGSSGESGTAGTSGVDGTFFGSSGTSGVNLESETRLSLTRTNSTTATSSKQDCFSGCTYTDNITPSGITYSSDGKFTINESGYYSIDVILIANAVVGQPASTVFSIEVDDVPIWSYTIDVYDVTSPLAVPIKLFKNLNSDSYINVYQDVASTNTVQIMAGSTINLTRLFVGSSGSHGSSGISGTSGTSGNGTAGTSGDDGTSGISGTSGTSGGGGSSIIKIANLTLTGSSWSLVSGYYEYNYSNTGITTDSVIFITPNRESITTVQISEVQPYVSITGGTVTIYALNDPGNDIVVDMVIM